MNINEALAEAGAGFAVGFGIGFYFNKTIDDEYQLNILETNLPKKLKENEEIEDLLDGVRNNLKEMKKTGRILQIVFPAAISGLYSILSSSVLRTSNSYLEKTAVTLPSIYIGVLAGGLAKKLITKGRKEDLKLLKQAMQDSDNLDRYLLPNDKSEEIRQTFSEVEEMIVNDKNFNHKNLDDYVKRLYKTITKKPKIYTPALLDWAKTKSKEVIEHAHLQRQIKEFYEKNNLMDSLESIVIGQAALFRPLTEPRLRVFIKEGDKFYIETITLHNFKIDMDLENGCADIESGGNATIKSGKELFDGNYKKLAGRILKEQKDYSIMLMKTPFILTDRLRKEIILKKFLPEYCKYYLMNEESKN